MLSSSVLALEPADRSPWTTISHLFLSAPLPHGSTTLTAVLALQLTGPVFSNIFSCFVSAYPPIDRVKLHRP